MWEMGDSQILAHNMNTVMMSSCLISSAWKPSGKSGHPNVRAVEHPTIRGSFSQELRKVSTHTTRECCRRFWTGGSHPHENCRHPSGTWHTSFLGTTNRSHLPIRNRAKPLENSVQRTSGSAYVGTRLHCAQNTIFQVLERLGFIQ